MVNVNIEGLKIYLCKNLHMNDTYDIWYLYPDTSPDTLY